MTAETVEPEEAAAAPQTTLPGSDKAYRWGLGAGFTAAFAFIFWFTTYGVWCLGCMAFRDPRMDFLTAQGRAMLHGHLWVPGRFIGGECITTGGQCYGYFGIAPSILRMPYLLVVSSSVPDITQVYMLFGFSLTLIATTLLLLEGWRRFQPQVSPAIAFALAFLAMVALGVGSPLLFLGTRPYVYEEVIVWGVAFALMGMWASLVWLRSERFEWAALAAGMAAMSALSRPHLCLAAVAFLLIVALIKARRAGKYDELTLAVVFSLAVVASPLVVNLLKFHTVGVPYERHAQLGGQPERLARTANSGESPAHIPTQVANYFRPDALKLTSDFPYVDFFYGRPDAVTGKEELVEAVWPATSKDFEAFEFSSLTSTGPLFVILLCVAAYALVRRRNFAAQGSEVSLPLVLTAGAAIPLLATFGFYGVVERYKADALPLLVWLVAWTLPFLLRELRLSLVRPLVMGVAVLTAYQAFVMFGLGLMAYPAPADAPVQASLRLDRVREALGMSTESKIWQQVRSQRDQPLAADANACGAAPQPGGEGLSLQLQLPDENRRVETLLQYSGPTVGYTRVSQDRLFIILGLNYGQYSAVGPLAVQPGPNKLSLQRVGNAGRSCLSWNGAPLTLMDVSSPARPEAIGRNSVGSAVTTDDFRGKVLSATQE